MLGSGMPISHSNRRFVRRLLAVIGFVSLAFAIRDSMTLAHAGFSPGDVDDSRATSDEQWKERLEGLLRANDPDAPALLAEGVKARPRLRAWAFTRLLSLGPSGQAALTALGTEGVDLALQTESRLGEPERFDPRAVFRAVGPSASDRLFDLVDSPDPSLRQKAMTLLTQLQDRRNVDRLTELAKTNPNLWIRVQAAQGVSLVDPGAGAALLIPFLPDPRFGWVAADGLADVVSRVDDDRARDALTEWLKDVRNPREKRWLVSKKLASSRRPGARELARQFGPTGAEGGDPESPFGARLAAAIGGGVCLVLLFALGRRGDLSVWQRLGVVTAGVIGSYVGAVFLLAYWVAWSPGAFMSSGPIHGLQAMKLLMMVLVCVTPTVAVWFVRWMTSWKRASALLVGVGSGAGMLAGILIHERMYSYGLPRSPLESPLTLSITYVFALVASYWPRGLIFAE